MSNDNGMFDFDTLPRKEKKVKYKGKMYDLREASEEARMRYEGHNYKSMEKDGDDLRIKPTELLPQGSSLLVAACLYEEGTDKNVQVSVVRSWPHHYVDQMFEWIMENSIGLRSKPSKDSIEKQIGELHLKLAQIDEKKTTEEEVKNLHPATETTSR